MSLDGKLLAKARDIYYDKKVEFGNETDRRYALVYRKNPRVRELDEKLRESVMQAVGEALKTGGDAVKALEDVSRENLDMQREREEELKKAGFAPDFLDRDYMCPKCRDTGFEGGVMCSCLGGIYKELQRRDLSSLIRLGNERFESFRLDWYDGGNMNPDSKRSDREDMENILLKCMSFAYEFGSHSLNLYLCGGTGLGKTFLSACIARVVSEAGYSVVYETSSGIFTKFEIEKFAKTSDLDAARAEIRRILSCDLLILDDLGTELTTSFTISTLYEIINTRLIYGRKTVINSNIMPKGLEERYSQQIVSRILGEYQIYCFRGRDIRIEKNFAR